MNKKLVSKIKTIKNQRAKKVNELLDEHDAIKRMEPKNIAAQNAKAEEANKEYAEYQLATEELKKYEMISEKVEDAYRASLKEEKGSEEEKAAYNMFLQYLKVLREFEEKLAEKYEVELDVEERKEETPVDDEELDEKKDNKKKGTGKRVIAGVLAIAAAAGLGYGLRGCSDKSQTQDGNIAIVDTELDEELTGKYGEFTDASNEEQVKARAQYIYDNYYSDWVNELTPDQQKNITPEKIANIIRVMNGELPLDADGNRYYDVNVVDETVNSFVNITANLPSSSTLDSKTNEEIGQIKDIPMHMFAVDGSETSEFIKPYDEDFTNIIDGRNHHNGEKTVNAIKSLGEKMWREFVMVGRNYQNDDGTLTNYRNPYDLPAQQRALAWIGATQRYGAIALPYNLNGMQAVCIDVCVNYNTKELNAVPVNEIYEGYHSGLYSSIIARLAGLPEKHDPDTIGFVQDLNDQLEFKYKELKQMTLK